ncbi:MAG: DUF3306 domain-containing protein [Hyphomicrobiaceae bacterium]
MTGSSEDGFLTRWSRRKLEARGSRPDAEAQQGPDGPARHAALDSGRQRGDAAASPEQLDAPGETSAPAEGKGRTAPDFADFDFDKLDFQSDYRQFMDADVPHDVRNKALRKLWLSNPVLANMDGLDDYCEDYTDAAMVPLGGVKTAYRLGRGFLSDDEVAEWEALGRPEKEIAAVDDTSVGADEAAADEIGRSEPGDEIDAPDEASDGHEQASGAACGVAVKLEEQTAIGEYEATATEVGGSVPRRAGEA